MNKIIIICFCLFMAACSNEQGSDANDTTKIVKEQAQAMGDILVKRDYVGFVKCTYPKIVELMGGEKKMMDVMEKGAMEMEKEGSAFLEVTIGEPSEILKAGNQLQCTVPIFLYMKVPGGRLKNSSTLIAISEDNGTTWYFVDTSGKSIDVMKKVLPELSADLVIPEKKNPQFTKDH